MVESFRRLRLRIWLLSCLCLLNSLPSGWLVILWCGDISFNSVMVCSVLVRGWAGMVGKRRGDKGQILVLILLVLVAAVVVFALLSARSSRVAAAPKVVEAFWRVDGHKVTSVSVGDKVEAHVAIQATEQYVGSVVVKIRKDVAIWPDSDYSVVTVPVDLRGEAERQISLEFVPDEASSTGGFGGLRGYFVEVEFSATGTSWTMDGGYPPRLQVTKID